jgi:integrase
MHELRIVRRGRRSLIPVAELTRWLEQSAERTVGRRPPPYRRRRTSQVSRSATRARAPNAAITPAVARPRTAPPWSQRDGRKIQRTFATQREAQNWRQEAIVDLRRGALRAPKSDSVRRIGEKWLSDARAGLVRNRSGDPYKPSVLRGYEQALRDRIYPDLGGAKLGDLTRHDVQALVDRLDEAGLSPSTVRNALLPLRAICRRALARGQIVVNPTHGLELRAVRSARDRVADPVEAAELLAALDADQALWATAMYAGLRRGELRALRWSDVDLGASVIHVRRGWDNVEGELEPKSRAGVRKVPIAAVLRIHLERLHDGGSSALAFGRNAARPFEPASVAERATKAWERAGLTRITLHECRHTFASLMIAAGVNAKALQTFMGHASIRSRSTAMGTCSQARSAKLPSCSTAILPVRGPSPPPRPDSVVGKAWGSHCPAPAAQSGPELRSES